VLIDALTAALATRGAPGRFDITLAGYNAPLVAPGDSITPMVGALDYDPNSGEFSAEITLIGTKTPVSSLRVSGTVAELANIPVLTQLMPIHAAIAADEVKLVTVRLPAGTAGIARSVDQLVGQALRHVLQAGQPVPLDELTSPLAVAANAAVEMDLVAGGLTLQGRAIAEQGGAVGDVIRVRNPSSLAVMLAVITGPNLVRVDPDSQPIVSFHNQEFAAQ
jgi:flagella basal body P-ring formation protein FlgA